MYSLYYTTSRIGQRIVPEPHSTYAYGPPTLKYSNESDEKNLGILLRLSVSEYIFKHIRNRVSWLGRAKQANRISLQCRLQTL